MIDAARQRSNMVESQILTSDVTDRRILRAMGELPRERFVPPALAALAYMDEAVPLSAPAAGRRWLMAPRVFAKLLQLAEIGEEDRVLDVGCGSGYSAAVLAKIARSVVANVRPCPSTDAGFSTSIKPDVPRMPANMPPTVAANSPSSALSGKRSAPGQSTRKLSSS